MEYYSAIKEWNNVISNSMNGPSLHVILSEESQREKEKQHDIPYMWNQKMMQMKFLTKQKKIHR